MYIAVIRIGLFLISWLSVFFIPKDEFRKYTPVATFATVLVLAQSVLSIPFKWWTVKGGLLNKVLNDFSFIFGPFFIGTIWIFKLTYGRFWLYTSANLLMDVFLAFPVNSIFEKLKVYKLVNFKPKHIFYLSTCFAFVIYGYQLFITRPKSKIQ